MEISAPEYTRRKRLNAMHFGFSMFLALVTLSDFTQTVAIAGDSDKGKSEVASAVTVPIVSGSAVKEAISLSTQYLEHACEPSGRFVYVVNMQSNSKSPRYNIIRHAGAMYALAMANNYNPDQGTVDALVRAGRFLRANYIGPDPASTEKKQILTVWSGKVGTADIPETTLGAPGLGLLALVEIHRIQPESIPLEDLRGMGRFLLFLQKEDGSFYSKYAAKEDGRNDAWESLYYPGETALGLLSLYDVDPSAEWLAAATKALIYLAKSRANAEKVPPDCWALIASAKLFALSDKTGVPIERDILLHHATQVCEGILGEQITNASEHNLNGGFDPTGRTAPTATRMEGLLATLDFLPKEQNELRSRIEKAVRQGIAFLLQSQVKFGPYAGAIPGSIGRISADTTDGTAANPLSSKVRIDYVQHALCAWLRYLRLFPPIPPQKLEK